MNTYEQKELTVTLLGSIDKREIAIENARNNNDRKEILLNVNPEFLWKDLKEGVEKTRKKYGYCLSERTKHNIAIYINILTESCKFLQKKFNHVNKTSFRIYGKSFAIGALTGARSVLDELYGNSMSEKIENFNQQYDDIKHHRYDQSHLESDSLKMIIGAIKGVLKSYEKGVKNVENYNDIVDDFFECRYSIKKKLADGVSILFCMIEEDYDMYQKRKYSSSTAEKKSKEFCICIHW